MSKNESTVARWNDAIRAAREIGRDDLAWSMCRKAAHEGRVNGRVHPGNGAWVVDIGLTLDHPEEVLAFWREIRPSERAAILPAVYGSSFYWPEARPIVAELAHLALRTSNPDWETLQSAYFHLSEQENPDADELGRIFEQYSQAVQRAKPEADRTLPLSAYRIDLALIRGDYQQAERELAGALQSSERIPYGLTDALEFLRSFGPTLRGDRELWRRVGGANHLSNGSWLLSTRDGHVGFVAAGEQVIRELPPPEAHWHCMRTSVGPERPSRNDLALAVGFKSLYEVNATHTGWDKLAQMPFYLARQLDSLDGSLRTLAEILREHPQKPAEIVWPAWYWPRSSHKLKSLMLSDGTWFTCDPKSSRVWEPRKIAQDALGVSVDICEVLPVDETVDRAYLLTSQGLLLWHPPAGEVKRIALPGERKPLPVTTTTEGRKLPEGKIRIGLFPADGGTTYIVDIATNEIVREGLINESVPGSYWKQMPMKARRDMVDKAMRDAQLEWPWNRNLKPLE